eukprot:364365-Chlamydomonas_euryale.AAC.15
MHCMQRIPLAGRAKVGRQQSVVRPCMAVGATGRACKRKAVDQAATTATVLGRSLACVCRASAAVCARRCTKRSRHSTSSLAASEGCVEASQARPLWSPVFFWCAYALWPTTGPS